MYHEFFCFSSAFLTKIYIYFQKITGPPFQYPPPHFYGCESLCGLCHVSFFSRFL